MRCQQYSLVLALLSLSVAVSARAQSGTWGMGVGVAAPTGEYSTHDKAGWHASATYTPVRFGPAVDLRIDALYGRTPRKTTGAAASQVFGLGAALLAHPSRSVTAHPYVLAGIGYYELEEGGLGGVSSTPTSGIAIIGGAGISVPAGGPHVFLEARFIGGPVKNGVNFVAVTLGISF
ncbi:MAG TPA: outer membrane beta-barrel protein [Gemmatimonadales bacterium]|nr:outer membrane beta-barrel protein [Gemmatimonadales bacterium]